MTRKPWIGSGESLDNGLCAGRLLHAGPDWQVLAAEPEGLLLLADSELAEHWIDHGLLRESVLEPVTLPSGGRCRALVSADDLTLAPLDACARPGNLIDALSFAAGLKATRALAPGADLQGAIFCERLARLLPTRPDAQAPDITDSRLLGRWLSGGTQVDSDDAPELLRLTGWMGEDAVRKVLRAAGLADEDGDPARGFSQTRRRALDDAGGRISEAPAAQMQTGPSLEETSRRLAGMAPFELPGRSALEQFFREHILDILQSPERYVRLGIAFPGAMVLHGPPGSGKTFAVRRLIDHLGWPSFSIDSGSVGSPYIHETSRKLVEMFDNAIAQAPAVVVIDEMEAFVSDRQSSPSGAAHHVEETAQFLQCIPRASAAKVLVAGMTNHLDMIDPAILRRGRFDHVVEVGMPGDEEVAALLQALLLDKPTEPDLGLAAAIRLLSGRPLSDADFVVREAARLAARAGNEHITALNLAGALRTLPEGAAEGARPIGFIWD